MIIGFLFFALLYILALMQTSFLVHFFPVGFVPNVVLVAVLLVNVLEGSRSYVGVSAAVFGGLLLDLFSDKPIGFWILILVVISLVMKIALERYVRIPISQKI